MPDELVAQLDAAATRYDRTRAWIIRWCCIAKMDEEQAMLEPTPVDPSDPGSALRIGPNSYAVGPEQFAVRTEQARQEMARGCHFKPSERNALRCATCGGKRAAHIAGS